MKNQKKIIEFKYYINYFSHCKRISFKIELNLNFVVKFQQENVLLLKISEAGQLNKISYRNNTFK